MNWAKIKGYEDKYMVSDFGSVKNINTGKLMSVQVSKLGYSHINLWDGAKYNKAYIHRLVALHFIPNTLNKPEVNHLDFNPRNNAYSNLEWVTESENRLHSSNIKNVWGFAKEKVPVLCINKRGNIVNTYKSISDAERDTKIPQQNISKVISGERKTAGGFLWAKH